MYYVMSEPHGNAEAYFDMKKKINYSVTDQLYILGDVLGGDPAHPEQCLKILDDIMEYPNIHLVLGDFEYNYVLYEMENNYQKRMNYKNKLSSLYGGAEFINYMDTLPWKVKQKYIDFLFAREVSEVIFAGQRLFYLVHGSPAVCASEGMGDLAKWQRKVVETPLGLKSNYKMAILSDGWLSERKDIDFDKVVVIAGHKSTASFENNKSILRNHAPMIFIKNRLMIHCGNYEDGECIDNTLCCLEIDDGGEHITIYYRHED